MQAWGNCVKDGIPTLSCIPVLFNNFIYWALYFSGAVAFFFILWAGIKYINSGGDAKTVESAQKTLTYAIIGLVIVFLSFFVVNIIAGLTGADCLTKPFGFQNCQ